MSTQEHDTIDLIAHQPDGDIAVLIIVEDRPWGDRGELLHDLQAKLNTYLSYITEGRLEVEYPSLTGRPVLIELRCSFPPGDREIEFLEIVGPRYFAPLGIRLTWRLIGGCPIQ